MATKRPTKSLKKEVDTNPPVTEQRIFQQPKQRFSWMTHQHFTKVVFVLALVSIVAAFFFFWQWNQLRKTPENMANNQLEKTIQRVSKLVDLPTDETPTLAVVSNPDLLKDQPFLSKAAKGDDILIYTKAKKAYIYDPARNKIVDIAAIDLGTPSK